MLRTSPHSSSVIRSTTNSSRSPSIPIAKAPPVRVSWRSSAVTSAVVVRVPPALRAPHCPARARTRRRRPVPPLRSAVDVVQFGHQFVAPGVLAQFARVRLHRRTAERTGRRYERCAVLCNRRRPGTASATATVGVAGPTARARRCQADRPLPDPPHRPPSERPRTGRRRAAGSRRGRRNRATARDDSRPRSRRSTRSCSRA